MMSDSQLYLSVGLPVMAILISLLVQLQAVHSLRASVDKRMGGFNGRMERFEDLLSEMRTTFIKDHAERLVRLETSVFHTH